MQFLQNTQGEDPDGYGNYLLLEAIYNKKTYLFLYAHLSQRLIAVDQSVVAGEVIGNSGISGNANKAYPHLHFGVYEGTFNNTGLRNPVAVIPEIARTLNVQPPAGSQPTY